MARRKIIHLAIILSMLLTAVSVVVPAAVRADAYGVVPKAGVFNPQTVGSTSAPINFTVTNIAGSDIEANNVTIIQGGADFFVTGNGCLATNLNEGERCEFGVIFSPSAVGLRRGQASIASDRGPSIVELSGIGTSPSIEIAPLSLDFGAQQIGTTSVGQSVTLRNTGQSGVTVNAPTLSDTTNYKVATNTCTGTIAPNATCSVGVVFTPQAPAGLKPVATLSITTTAAGGPVNAQIPISGTALAPRISITTSPAAFQPQQVNTYSASQRVTVTNTGSGPVSLDGAGLVTNTDFVIFNNTCGTPDGQGTGHNTTLLVNGTCSFDVVFRPLAAGQRVDTAAVAFESAADGGAATVQLTGTGLTNSSVASFSPTPFPFATTPIGSVSAAQIFTLTNNGTASITTMGAATLTTPIANDFTIISSSCDNVTIAATKTCTVTAAFTPQAGSLGARGGALAVTIDGQAVVASLTGNAAPKTQELATFDPASYDFGTSPAGQPGAPHSFKLMNTGTLPIGPIATTTIVGSAPSQAQFEIVSAGCNGLTLNPGESCTTVVRFFPNAVGTYAASLQIALAGNGPFLAGLSGVATTPQVTIDPAQLTFTPQQIGTQSAVQTITYRNVGAGTVQVTNVALIGTDFILANNSCIGASLVTNGSCTVGVASAPTTQGVKSAAVRFTDSTTNSPRDIPVNGSGITAQATIDPAQLNFGSQQIGTQSALQTITYRNISASTVQVTTVALIGTDFVLANNSCTGATLSTGGTCTVSVGFAPASQGVKAATVRFTDSTAASPRDILLNGNGVFPVPVVAAAAVDFGNQLLGTTSAEQVVTVSNVGIGTLIINSVTVTGPNAGDFQITGNTCGGGAQLTGSQTCQVRVVFKPTAVGARTASLSFATNGAGGMSTVPLTGNGTPIPSYIVTVNTAGVGCTAAASPAGPYLGNQMVTLTATINSTTTIFNGWTLDGTFVGFANPLNFSVNNSSHNVLATCSPRPTFVGVNSGTPYSEAIAQLAARGFIRGYGDGTFGPNDGILRAQMAAITTRLAGWSTFIKPNIFTDRCNASGCVDDELWNSVAVTAFYQVARGYEDNTYRPFESVANIQAVAFITRTMVKLGYWQFQPDNVNIYPNIDAGTGHRIDISTYYFYAGAVPGTDPTSPWAGWNQPSTRGYFAGIYWQAYQSYFGVDRVP